MRTPARPGTIAGPKPAAGKDQLDTVKRKIASHALEQVEKKARLLHLLDTLYDEGVCLETADGTSDCFFDSSANAYG